MFVSFFVSSYRMTCLFILLSGEGNSSFSTSPLSFAWSQFLPSYRSLLRKGHEVHVPRGQIFSSRWSWCRVRASSTVYISRGQIPS